VDGAPPPVADVEDDPVPVPPAPRDRVFASPLVRRLAKERGIDLSTVRGSGPQGRIVRRDLDSLPTPSTSVSDAPAASAPSAEASGYRDEPHTPMRRAIARRLTESATTVPHFFLTADCRVDELLALRTRINERTGSKVSVNDFALMGVAAAMADVPRANAIWMPDAIRRFETVDIGVAVSIPGGLVTPVLRDAGSKSLGEVSAAVRDLASRARDGKLKQHEIEGGSFAVSNLGMYGTKEFTAIINPPHAGILAVGAATRRPVVDGGELAVGSVMTVTLSADHRVMDGALAAEWLAAFVAHIENPLGLLL
jgi:pyruvate dehydrogenase E2 component (dihydrolipoamide acetyltransferase)